MIMDYVQELRKLIGHRPLILVGATILVFDKNNQLLMQKRADNGTWGVPGGSMDPGETLEETARRETFEETGIKLGKIKFIKIYSGPELFYEYPNGDQIYIVTAVFLAKDFSQTTQGHDEEVLEIHFYPLDNLPKNISPSIQIILNDLKPQLLPNAL
jgi:8-oxo-dGTP pyrophosphatase MutT (NUDIX family)